ncbi:type IV secretory system conjugative DNA transfer family protein [Edaphobacter dinghuensis]|nr:type IV secretory system conjugative DNA transfer family protein [Edaphobacter dinghuensis]
MVPDYSRTPRSSGDDLVGVVVLLVCALCAGLWYVAVSRFNMTHAECLEIFCYVAIGLFGLLILVTQLIGRRERKEAQWPHPPLFVPSKKDEKVVAEANKAGETVLGYNVHGEPWVWPDAIRARHGIIAGGTGAGKSTFLKNIIVQDLHRTYGGRRMPMIIFDGKGDEEFLEDMLPHITAAGRLQDLRVVNPTNPQKSVKYNPFIAPDDLYQEHVNFIFQSFGLQKDFFEGHQEAYLYDLARILQHTGKAFNTRDILVMALDENVLAEQIALARKRISLRADVTTQARQSFEMSARMLQRSFKDRDRVEKIQGLLNELVAFLEDNLSIITGSYQDNLTPDQVVDEGLVLWVLLNLNKNKRACEAFGKIMLKNIQLTIGKRYSTPSALRDPNAPYLSVLFDEIGPFVFPDFPHGLQTARGAKVMMLFSTQAVPQFQKLGQAFADELISAPATKMIMHGSEENTVQWFMKASSRVTTKRRTLSVRKTGLFAPTYRETGTGSESDARETRAREEHIKNLPVGQMEILMADALAGTLHSHLHVRHLPTIRLAGLQSDIYPQMHVAIDPSIGANLRFSEEGEGRPRRRMSGVSIAKFLGDQL